LCKPAHPEKPGYELQDGKSGRLETERLAAWLADEIEGWRGGTVGWPELRPGRGPPGPR
jgi:hypothetical protein